MTCGTAKQASISKPPVSWMRTIPLVTIEQSESLHLVHKHVWIVGINVYKRAQSHPSRFLTSDVSNVALQPKNILELCKLHGELHHHPWTWLPPSSSPHPTPSSPKMFRHLLFLWASVQPWPRQLPKHVVSKHWAENWGWDRWKVFSSFLQKRNEVTSCERI